MAIQEPRPSLEVLLNRLVAEYQRKNGLKNKTAAVAGIADVLGYSTRTVYNWLAGSARPPDSITFAKIAALARGLGLDRKWGTGLVSYATQIDGERILNETWDPEHLKEIYCNLKPPMYSEFIGRDTEVKKLMQRLAQTDSAHIISIDGPGGLGKTTLGLEVAHRCLAASRGQRISGGVPLFDAIIFASAKQEILGPSGRAPISRPLRTLQAICQEIANTINELEVGVGTSEDLDKRTVTALQNYVRRPRYVLLIVDNFETIRETEKDNVLDFILSLPREVKVIITTREPIRFHATVTLSELSERDSLALIEAEAGSKEPPLAIDKITAASLYRRIGGNPGALVYCVGLLSATRTLSSVLKDEIRSTSGPIAFVYFNASVASLEPDALNLLLAVAFFPKRPLKEAAASVANLAMDPPRAERAQAELVQRSLITETGERYNMLPLTREYAMAKLARHRNFTVDAEARWLRWYQDFVEKYGGEDSGEWHERYDRLEEEWENLLAVSELCVNERRYEILSKLWGRQGLATFSSVYGHWLDKMMWQSKVADMATSRGDMLIRAEMWSEIGWTKTLIGDDASLKEAWKLLQDAYRTIQDIRGGNTSSEEIQLAAVANYLRLALHQRRVKEFALAHAWLDRAQEILTPELRQRKGFDRRYAEMWYYRGMSLVEQGELEAANEALQATVVAAEVIGWLRVMVYAYGYLAEVAVRQKKWEEAHRLIRLWGRVADANKDTRRVAFFNYTHAKLKRAQGDNEDALDLATKTLPMFRQLGMQPEARDLEQFIRSLQTPNVE